MNDDQFLHKTRRATIALAAWIGVWLAVSGGGQYLWGLLSGAAVGLFSLWSLERLAGILQPPEGGLAAGRGCVQRACRRFVLISACRYALFGAALYVLFSPPRVSVGAFVLGVSMPLWVMVMKTVGQMILPAVRRSVRG